MLCYGWWNLNLRLHCKIRKGKILTKILQFELSLQSHKVWSLFNQYMVPSPFQIKLPKQFKKSKKISINIILINFEFHYTWEICYIRRLQQILAHDTHQIISGRLQSLHSTKSVISLSKFSLIYSSYNHIFLILSKLTQIHNQFTNYLH